MFGLIAGFVRQALHQPEYQILILGLDNAGKTTLLETMKGLYTKIEPIPPQSIPPTVGLNIAKITVEGTKLIFWDLGGQAGLRSIWEKYYAEANALIYVIDSSDHERFEEAKNVLDGVLQSPELSKCALLVFANKQDVPNAIPGPECENMLKLPSSNERLWKLQPVSALKGTGVKEGIKWLSSHFRTERH